MDSLEFLRSVWREQGEGFAFLSFKDSNSGWQDLAFRWDEDGDGDGIELPDAKYGDVYFCPNLFSGGRRRKDTMRPSCWLYADLDEVDPQQIREEYGRILVPTCAWESSPGRYQAMWLLDKLLDEEEHSEVNRLLTYLLGADKAGWDSTQVLRVPGTVNHKYSEKPEVKLLWTP